MNTDTKPCTRCGEDDPAELDQASPDRWWCRSCILYDHHSELYGPIQAIYIRRKRDYLRRLSNGGYRRKQCASMRCLADPDHAYVGSYFYEVEFKANLEEGIIPSGSLWLNDHNQRVYEVQGEVGEPQEMVIVGQKRLKLLEYRFPRLRRAISNPAVS